MRATASCSSVYECACRLLEALPALQGQQAQGSEGVAHVHGSLGDDPVKELATRAEPAHSKVCQPIERVRLFLP